jgi:Tfp pilus assembly protein PilW
MSEKKSRMTALLIALVVIMALVFVYAFIIKPSYNGYVTKIQTDATSQEDLKILNAILAQVNSAGYIQLPIPGTNQTVTLIPPQLCSQLNASK